MMKYALKEIQTDSKVPFFFEGEASLRNLQNFSI